MLSSWVWTCFPLDDLLTRTHVDQSIVDKSQVFNEEERVSLDANGRPLIQIIRNHLKKEALRNVSTQCLIKLKRSTIK